MSTSQRRTPQPEDYDPRSDVPAERLAHWVLLRRRDLGEITQLDVHAAGGPSNTTLTEIENARIEALTSPTSKKLDTGLRWEKGSARRVWLGAGEPRPAPVNIETPIRPQNVDKMRALIETDETLSPATRARLLGVLDESADSDAKTG